MQLWIIAAIVLCVQTAAFGQSGRLRLESAPPGGFDPPGRAGTSWDIPHQRFSDRDVTSKQSASLALPPAVGNWDQNFALPGTDGVVNAVVTYGSSMVVGGSFRHAGGAVASNIAAWDGSSWTEFGGGIDGAVFALAEYSGLLYVGGRFTLAGTQTVSNLAMWNGSVWTDVGGGVGGAGDLSAVYALEVDGGGDLYVGGYFVDAGSVTAFCVALWNGSTWSDLDSGLGSAVYALDLKDGVVYAGGRFTSMGALGTAVKRVAKYNGVWSSVGTGVDGEVYSLLFFGARLYIAGDFSKINAVSANHIAYCYPSTNYCGKLPEGEVDGPVFGLAELGSNLIVTGLFDNAGPEHSPGLAFYTWTVGWTGATGVNGIGEGNPAEGGYAVWVAPLATWGDDIVVVGGSFGIAETTRATNIAGYRVSSGVAGNWERMAAQTAFGANGPVRALASLGDQLYVGGYFTSIGDREVVGIAVKSGIQWQPLGAGIDGGAVLALAATASGAYAGGTFYTAGGQPAGRVAYWNGSAWDDMDGGVSAPYPAAVYAVATSGNNVFVGGQFLNAGSVESNSIAFWNGTSWSALGDGVEGGSVLAIAVSNDDVYIGGSFTLIDGKEIANLAKYDGSEWHAVGGGVNGEVHALLVSGSDLYVGGAFSQVGGTTPANNIAKWNGSSWSALGAGLTGEAVRTIVGDGAALFVGGNFDTSDGESASNVAMWEVVDWLRLDIGTDEAVSSLVLHEFSVYAGGYFGKTGPEPSSYIGRWILDAGLLPAELVSFRGINDGNSVVLRWEADSETNLAGYAVEGRTQGSTAFERIGFVEATASGTYDFEIKSVEPGRYSYRLLMEDLDGTVSYSSVIEVEVHPGVLPTFEPPYPNPASVSTRLGYRLAADEELRVELRDVLGRLVSAPLNALGSNGSLRELAMDVSHLTPGIYFCRLETDRGVGVVRQLVVAR